MDELSMAIRRMHCVLALVAMMSVHVSSCDDHCTAWVADVNRTDWITQLHVLNLLKSHGISCSMMGSDAYSVVVPDHSLSQATQVLASDIKFNHYDIYVHDGSQGQCSRLKYYIKNRRFDDAVGSEKHKLPDELLAAL